MYHVVIIISVTESYSIMLFLFPLYNHSELFVLADVKIREVPNILNFFYFICIVLSNEKKYYVNQLYTVIFIDYTTHCGLLD